MNRLFAGVRDGAVAAVAVCLLAAGCSGGGSHADDRAAGLESPTGPGTSGSRTPTPAVHTTPAPPYPTGAAGCHQNRGWSAERAAEWVQFGQITSRTTSEPRWGHVRFDKSHPGFDGPLCQPVTVQVQYWKITYRAADDDPAGTEDAADYSFALTPLQRTQVRVDGRTVRDVHAPKSTGSGKPGPCVGYLAAIYTGSGPLGPKELPTEIQTGGLVGQSVSFPTKRVADSRLQEPSAPQTCDRSGHPVSIPRYPTGASGLPGLPDLMHPTTLPPFSLNPR
jgi:hypothetical protein